MHSINSTDAKSTIPELCISAIASGLKEIAVTDHFEPQPGNEEYSQYSAGNYFFDLMKVRAVFRGQLIIKRGVELGQPHLYPESSGNLINSHFYDFVLGSAHKMKNGIDFGDIVYSSENVSFYCDRYLDELKALAEWNRFDCLAHLDLVKRYAAKYGVRADLMRFRDRLEEILRLVIDNGRGIEVNTSGLRQSAHECMPGLELLRLYRQLGGEIVTVGSDAHRACDVGKGIISAVELIESAGFRYVTVYTNRRPSMIKISDHSSSCLCRYSA